MLTYEQKLDLEQKRLDTVIETITQQIDKLENETGRRRAEVINIRKHFWDDVKVNTDTFDDYLETVINLRQQAQSLAVTQITHKHTFNRLAALRRMQKHLTSDASISLKKANLPQNKSISVFLPLLMQAEKTFLFMTGAPQFQVFITTTHQDKLSTTHQAA